ncbi:hypothetical protein B0H11DRAFT_1953784 [Mycena galericulata]|nr:hypothetical protein B0H11DRAFT_1953784 [Mycena galericulata]
MDEIARSILHYSCDVSLSEEIRELIRQTETEIAEIDAQIIQAALDIASLAARKHNRQQKLSILRATLSPIRQIPAEILAHIFTYCLKENLHSYSILSSHTATMVLTHVCARWRAVALATPRLWENMSLRLKENMGRNVPSFLPEVLQRSLPHELFVDINVPPLATNSQLEDILPLIDRAKTLKLKLPDSCLRPLLTLTASNLLRLQTLHLFAPEYPWSEWPEERGPPEVVRATDFIPAFSALPSLRNLIVSLPLLPQPVETFVAQYPWSQLTYLNLGLPLNIATARYILRLCTNLVDGTLWRVLGSDADTMSFEVTALVHLRSFLFRFEDNHDWSHHALFNSFALPALRALHIDDRRTSVTPVLVDLHSRSGFSLQELTLEYSTLTAAQLIAFLQKTPTLRELRLVHCNSITNELFDALTSRLFSGRPLLLPSLTRIELECSINPEWSVDILADMIESRWDPTDGREFGAALPTTPLKHVALTFRGYRPFEASVEIRFRRMASAGLLIDVRN